MLCGQCKTGIQIFAMFLESSKQMSFLGKCLCLLKLLDFGKLVFKKRIRA